MYSVMVFTITGGAQVAFLLYLGRTSDVINLLMRFLLKQINDLYLPKCRSSGLKC